MKENKEKGIINGRKKDEISEKINSAENVFFRFQRKRTQSFRQGTPDRTVKDNIRKGAVKGAPLTESLFSFVVFVSKDKIKY